MNRVWGLFIAMQLLLISAYGEMRIWTSTKGDSIEAEFVNIIGTKVVLKSSEGKTLKVPKTGLCRADQEYLATVIPPQIDIDVDVDKDRDTIDSYSSTYGTYNYERKAETIKCVAEIKKTNREPCNREFTAYLYVIGEATARSRRKVLSKVEHKFDFKNAKSTILNSSPVTVEYTKSNYANDGGWRYEGFLAYVVDGSGNVIAIETSGGAYDRYLPKFKDLSENDEVDDNFDKFNRK